MEIRIRHNEGLADQPNLLIDTVWDVKKKCGIWIIDNQMLKHDSALYTCIILCLFTDKKLGEGMTAPDGTKDQRGWFGDSLLLDGEFEIGSYLWTLDREYLTDGIEQTASDFAVEALQPLVDQKVISQLNVQSKIDRSASQLEISLDCFSHKDQKAINQKFNLWWEQTR
ncbi:MAG: phage GP46 family protein [Rhizobiales bacterium]|nr:phage GP46 family protein [Hyphomicrobiales bacterium]NRB13112.1 phage GP46 family protein [Hyphomicrobiales bacterium]